MGDRFIVQDITWATAHILELNPQGAYDMVASVQAKGPRGAREEALRLAELLNCGGHELDGG